MVNSNSTAQGVTVARYDWGVITTGTRADLIEQGIVAEPLPGDPGENKWTKRATDPQGRPINIRRLSRHRFEIQRRYDATEAEAHKAERERRRERDEAHALVHSWPKTAAKFREDVQWSAERLVRYIESLISDGVAGGYRYDDDAQLRFRLITDQLLQLVNTAGIVLDPTLREQYVPPLVAGTVRAADAARRDKDFQRFMQEVNK